jgi:hypothetical protein
MRPAQLSSPLPAEFNHDPRAACTGPDRRLYGPARDRGGRVRTARAFSFARLRSGWAQGETKINAMHLSLEI